MYNLAGFICPFSDSIKQPAYPDRNVLILDWHPVHGCRPGKSSFFILLWKIGYEILRVMAAQFILS